MRKEAAQNSASGPGGLTDDDGFNTVPARGLEYTKISKYRNSKDGDNGDNNNSRQQPPGLPSPNSPHKDPTPPGSPEGQKKGHLLPDESGDGEDGNGGDGGDDDSTSSSESSDSSCSSCDTEKSCCIDDNACGSFKLEDYKLLEILAHSCHIVTYCNFIRQFLGKLSVTSADKLLINAKYAEPPKEERSHPEQEGKEQERN